MHARAVDGERLMFMFNFSADDAECEDSFALKGGTLLHGRGFAAEEGKIRLAPYGFSVVKMAA